MMREELIVIDYEWKGTLEDKLRLASEYRLVESKIKDTLEYLKELEEEEQRIHSEMMSNLEVRL